MNKDQLRTRFNGKVICSLLLIFLLTFIIGSITPLHSDDFHYALQGLSFKAHYNHYMGWSGRLVADWCSDIILNLPFHWMMVAVQSAIMMGYCYLVAAIPAFVFKREVTWYYLGLIFVLYWVCNTNLGQTTFWIVGSCNYLVTNFFVLAFIYFCIRNCKTTNLLVKITGFVLGIIAGCTNENTSVMLVCLLPCICYLLFTEDDGINVHNFIFWWGGCIVGTALLLLAPGNNARLTCGAFDWWRKLSIPLKIKHHFGRLIRGLFYFIPLYILLLVNWIRFNFVDRGMSKKREFYWGALFFLAFVGAEIVMVASPGMPPRSYNGALTFLLLTFVFWLYVECENNKIMGYINKVLYLCVCVMFVKSYVLMYVSYSIAMKQNEMRISTINNSKAMGVNEFTIPGYYFPRLLRDRDMYDMYHSGAMGRFYGVRYIGLQEVDFDYSLINTGRKVESDSFSKEIKNFDVYVAESTLLLPKGRIAVYSTDKLNLDKVNGIKMVNKRDKSVYAYELQKSVAVQGVYCRGTTIMKDFKLSDYNISLY